MLVLLARRTTHTSAMVNTTSDVPLFLMYLCSELARVPVHVLCLLDVSEVNALLFPFPSWILLNRLCNHGTFSDQNMQLDFYDLLCNEQQDRFKRDSISWPNVNFISVNTAAISESWEVKRICATRSNCYENNEIKEMKSSCQNLHVILWSTSRNGKSGAVTSPVLRIL